MRLRLNVLSKWKHGKLFRRTFFKHKCILYSLASNECMIIFCIKQYLSIKWQTFGNLTNHWSILKWMYWINVYNFCFKWRFPAIPIKRKRHVIFPRCLRLFVAFNIRLSEFNLIKTAQRMTHARLGWYHKSWCNSNYHYHYHLLISADNSQNLTRY